MNGRVHGAAGLCISGWMLVHYPQDSLVVAAASIGGSALVSLLPDIDERRASLSLQPGANIISRIVTIFFKHRGFTHSLLAVLILFLTLKNLNFLPILIWTWTLVYLSHIFLDMFNLKGVQLFWPLPFWIAFLPNLISVSSRPYSIVQAILFVLFQFFGTLYILQALFTIFLKIQSLKLFGELWHQYIYPYISNIIF